MSLLMSLAVLLLALPGWAADPVPQVAMVWEAPTDAQGHPAPVQHYEIWRREVPCETRTRAMPAVVWVPQAELAIAAVSAEETAQPGWRAPRAIDDQVSTQWHTPWSTEPPPPLPHSLVLDLGTPATLTAFRYLPGQDGDLYGVTTQYQLSVSHDGTTWGQPVSTGTWAKDRTEKTVVFPPTPGRYLRFVALAEATGYAYTSAAELHVGTLATSQDGYTLVGSVPGTQTAYREEERPGLQCWYVAAVSPDGAKSPPSNVVTTPPERIEVPAATQFRCASCAE